MPAYADFAKFYDQIMGDRSALIERVRDYVRRYLPDAGSLLELGCGTGAVLAGLADGMQVTGVDLSPEMLAAAAANLTGARLVQADISEFSLGATFDVVICVFDTLNHLPTFDAWLAMFGQVAVGSASKRARTDGPSTTTPDVVPVMVAAIISQPVKKPRYGLIARPTHSKEAPQLAFHRFSRR